MPFVRFLPTLMYNGKNDDLKNATPLMKLKEHNGLAILKCLHHILVNVSEVKGFFCITH
tara:strand:+ start:1061 stop:1237 length:177 start_codon:yes stop_codon:yes gene_type:complete